MSYIKLKRAFDVVFAVVGASILSPLFILIVLLIKSTSSGPVIYRGERVGLNGRVFKILKFRSMVVEAEKIGGPSTALNDKRLTPIGRWLRKYKLDELPQIFNVLKGDMSFVGPRPQVKFYTDMYDDEEKLILSLKPGITDLSSLYFTDMDSTLGLNDVDAYYLQYVEPVKNRFRLRYVREASFSLDIKILIETFLRVLKLPSWFDLKLNVER